MKLCIISDTHNKHKHIVKLPDADVIIHCGDMTSIGHEHEIANFLKWFSKLNQYKYKIFIAGNHDWLFETNGQLARSLVPDNVIYLEDSGVEIEGKHFYGSPVQSPFFDWAFNRSEEKLKQHWEAIPNNIDVLITHSPPFMIGDYVPTAKEHKGSPSLRSEVLTRIKPIIHCYGHIHEGYGIRVVENTTPTTFINASLLNDDYLRVFNPILIEI
jgi:Icc-related predicted phosphoesterase